MKPMRGTELKRFLRSLDRPTRNLAILLHDVEDPVNVGAAFRIADACRVSQVLLTGITPQPPHRLIDKVGRMKHKKVKWRYVADVVEAIESMRTNGYEAVALELTEGAVRYDMRPYGDRVLLLAGHEDHGVTRRALEACDGSIFLPMYGKGASLNVSVALGIASYAILHAAAAPRID